MISRTSQNWPDGVATELPVMTEDDNVKHEPVVCQKMRWPGSNMAWTVNVGKGYKSKFECPACHRQFFQHLSFLGQRNIICNGEKLTKVAKDVA
jgi:hypothetical protein